MAEKLLSFPSVAAKLGVGENTVRRMLERGEFVQPLVVSPRRVAFRESEVDAWIAARPKGRLACPRSLQRDSVQAAR
jgi:prophage regulatory protein